MRSLPARQGLTAPLGSGPAAGLPQEVIPSLRWWRTRHPAQIAHGGLAELRAALSTTMWPGRSDWPAAARGHATTAIRLGLMILADAAPPAWTIDLAGSALLLCHADRNPIAGLVLDRFRRRFAAPETAASKGREA